MNVNVVRVGGFAAVVIFAVGAPFILPSHNLQLLAESLVLGASAMGFVFLYGYTGLASLAQMAYFAVSAYFIAVMTMTYSQNYWLAAICGILGAGVVAALFALLAYRTPGIYFLMMTLALSQLAYSVFLQWASVTGGFRGFSGIERPTIGQVRLIDTMPRYFFFAIVVLIVYLVLKLITNSKYGVGLQAGRDNELKMAALGVDVKVQRFTAHVIAGLVAGVAGVMGVLQYGVVSPATTGLTEILKMIMAAIIGGALWLEGGLLGALIVVHLISFVSSQTQRYWMIIGVIFVLTIIFLPNGIIGGFKDLKQWLAGRRKDSSIPDAPTTSRSGVEPHQPEAP